MPRLIGRKRIYFFLPIFFLIGIFALPLIRDWLWIAGIYNPKEPAFVYKNLEKFSLRHQTFVGKDFKEINSRFSFLSFPSCDEASTYQKNYCSFFTPEKRQIIRWIGTSDYYLVIKNDDIAEVEYAKP